MIAESKFSFFSALQTSQSVNQFFYNMAKTYWALKHVLFEFNYKLLTMHGEGEQRILKRHDPKMPQSVERKRLTCFLKLSTKHSSSVQLQWKCRQTKSKILKENVDKRSQNTLVQVNILVRQNSKVRRRVWIVPNNLHSAETWDCTRHFIEHGRAYIKILFLIFVHD